MSAATTGFIAGMFVGGLVVFVMLSVIITASRADEKEKRLFEEYLKEKRRVLIYRYREKHGELPKCNGNCWGCDYADVERKEENGERMIEYKPLTPELRMKIIEGVDNELMELSECRETAYVSAYRVGYRAFKTFIRGLPDGYPIPFEKEE